MPSQLGVLRVKPCLLRAGFNYRFSYIYVFISSPLLSRWNVLSALKKKKKKCSFFPPKDSTLSSLIKKKLKKKILAQACIANGHGIDSQVLNSSYIKIITATYWFHIQCSQKTVNINIYIYVNWGRKNINEKRTIREHLKYIYWTCQKNVYTF